jgi:hypothetical protein
MSGEGESCDKGHWMYDDPLDRPVVPFKNMNFNLAYPFCSACERITKCEHIYATNCKWCADEGKGFAVPKNEKSATTTAATTTTTSSPLCSKWIEDPLDCFSSSSASTTGPKFFVEDV